MYSFNTSERVFKTISTTPATGNRSTCPETVAFALESSTSFYIVCASDNSVSRSCTGCAVLVNRLTHGDGVEELLLSLEVFCFAVVDSAAPAS